MCVSYHITIFMSLTPNPYIYSMCIYSGGGGGRRFAILGDDNDNGDDKLQNYFFAQRRTTFPHHGGTSWVRAHDLAVSSLSPGLHSRPMSPGMTGNFPSPVTST
jgi:hypothetical protein